MTNEPALLQSVAPATKSRTRRPSIQAIALAVVLIALALQAVSFCSVAPQTLMQGVIIDDALYYTVPARHFVAGEGYSFDGVYRTSGVQPAWAIITTAAAAVIHDDIMLARALCLMSAACWLAAAVLLYLAAGKAHRNLGLLLGCAWAATGFFGGLAMLGMENGLHGLLMAAIAALVLRRLTPENISPRGAWRFYLGLGVLAGLLTLARTESGMFVAILGAAVFLGLLAAEHAPKLRLKWRAAILFSLPVILLVGGYVAFSAWYFGDWMPISGKVKLFYERASGPLAGGWWASVGRQSRAVFWQIAMGPVTHNIVLFVWRSFLRDVSRIPFGTIVLVASGAGLLVGLGRLLWNRCRLLKTDGRAIFLSVMGAGVILHFLMIATMLPHFTGYGRWYFSLQIMAFWALAAGGLAMLGSGVLALLHLPGRGFLAGAFTLVLTAALLVVTLVSTSPPEPTVHVFAQAGQWMNSNLPAGQCIGSLSSGYLSHYCPSHRVVNLDGLMNDRDYFENYLAKGRLNQYIQREGIGYFADYKPLAQWREGLSWCGSLFPAEKMRLLRWWPMDGEHAYCIWRLLGQDEQPTPAGDPLAQVQFDAAVMGQYRLVSDEQLGAMLSSTQPASNPRVFTTYASYPSRALRHVLMTPEQAAKAALTAETIPGHARRDIGFGQALTLRGLDAPATSVLAGTSFVLTRYWQAGQVEGVNNVRMTLWLSAPGRPPVAIHETSPCQETYPTADWQRGEIVAETYVVAVPPQTPAGPCSLWLSVVDQEGQPLPPHGANATVSQDRAWLMNLQVLSGQ